MSKSPTFTPSILITGKQIEQDAQGRWTGGWVKGPDGAALDHICHSFVTAGRILFLADCTHALKGQTIDLPDLPPWAADPTREEAPMTDTDQAPATQEVIQGEVGNEIVPQAPTEGVEGAAAVTEGTGGAETPESQPAPAAVAQDGDSEAADASKTGDQAEVASQTMQLSLDNEAFAKLAATMSEQIKTGLEGLQAQVDAKMEALTQELTEFAGHFEGKLESLLSGLDGLDPDKLNEVLGAIKESGFAELKARLDTLELKLRHTL